MFEENLMGIKQVLAKRERRQTSRRLTPQVLAPTIYQGQ